MNDYKKYFSSLLVTISLCLSDSGYNTIYLMEFDNLKNDFTNSHLKEALPDLIKENYKFREDIKVEYTGDISPYIEKYKSTEDDSIKGLIINGSFQTLNDKFYIDYEAYDFHTWERLVKQQIFCPAHDIICVHDAFLISIESNISPFLIDKIDKAATIRALERKGKQGNTHALEEEGNYNSGGAHRNLEQFHLGNELNDIHNNKEKYRNRYYREFNLKELIPHKFPQYGENSIQLNKILEKILNDPCNIIIGDLYLELDEDNSEVMLVELPIQYSMRNFLSQKLLDELPHVKYLSDNNNIIFQFSNNDFIFDEVLMEKLAFMQLQTMPVILFNDKIGRPQLIILDSWNQEYQNLESYTIPILFANQFKPLFSLTPGIDKVQLTLNTGTLETVYRFSIPSKKIGDYTKVSVKFMLESELNEFLENHNGDG